MNDDTQGPLSAEQQESMDRIKAQLGKAAPADATRVRPSPERELARLQEFLKSIALHIVRDGDSSSRDEPCEPFDAKELATAALDGLTLEEAKERCRQQGL